jgi:hypothetical protein
VKAERQKVVGSAAVKHQQRHIVKPINAEKIIYGKTELKRSISNVVSEVFNRYKFSSLPEFNAALKQFNVVADRGNEDGRIYKNKGLVYRVLDENGNKVGVPIKASTISCKPTLENLEKKFSPKVVGDALLKYQQRQITNAIDEAMKPVNDLEGLVNALKAKNVFTLLRQNDEGRIYGITFVDNERKIVFNGSDLGKKYSAASLIKRLEPGVHCVRPQADEQVTKDAKKHEDHKEEKRSVLSVPIVSSVTKAEEIKHTESISEVLMSTEANYQATPFQLKRKRKKKKRNNKKFTT